MRFTDKVVIVTGAAQGIGAATARAFAEEGGKVVVADINEVGGTALTKDIAAAGGTALFCKADVGDPDDARKLVQFALGHFGRLDVLINNAGIAHAAAFIDLSVDDFDRVMRVNVRGAFLCAQAAARQMLAQNANAAGTRGVIVNMSSVNAVLAIANQVPYTVSKGAINQLTKTMAVALAPQGVRVMAIGPGSIATELLKTAVMNDDAARDRLLSRTPLGRLGQPEEIAKVALFLASDDASYLTGTTVYPDGGRLGLNYVM